MPPKSEDSLIDFPVERVKTSPRPHFVRCDLILGRLSANGQSCRDSNIHFVSTCKNSNGNGHHFQMPLNEVSSYPKLKHNKQSQHKCGKHTLPIKIKWFSNKRFLLLRAHKWNAKLGQSLRLKNQWTAHERTPNQTTLTFCMETFSAAFCCSTPTLFVATTLYCNVKKFVAHKPFERFDS